MHLSAILHGLVLVQGVFASPVDGPAEKAPRHLEPRAPTFADIPFPRIPTRNKGNYNMHGGHNNNKGNKGGKGGKGGSDCGSDTNTQSNACSGGNPYCCSTNGDGHKVCSNTTACTQTIICCNNNNGYQICIGEMDFTGPITINVYE